MTIFLKNCNYLPSSDLNKPISRILSPPKADDGHLSSPAITNRVKRATKLALAPDRVYHNLMLPLDERSIN